MHSTNKLRPWLVGVAMLGLSLVPRSAFAAEAITTMLDGRELAFPTPVVVENDRTLVPARALLEALGATVGWDPETRTVSAQMGDTLVKTVIGATEAEVNGELVQLEVPPRIIDGNTLIPLRFFVQELGLAVAWDDGTRTIHIDTTRGTVSRDGLSTPRTGTPKVATEGEEAKAPETPVGETVVAEARKLVGLPYAWGGTSPKTGFDCSGFVTYLTLTFSDVDLPRTSYEMYNAGEAVAEGDLKAGDLVFFETYAEGPSHVGVYDGNGNFIHAQSQETGVKITRLNSDWWAVRYLGARRVYP
jgi:hypothetical protein